MKLVRRQDVIREVMDRFLSKPGPDSEKVGFTETAKTLGEVRSELKALDPATCSAEDIYEAVGTPGWVDFACDSCEREFPVLVCLAGDAFHVCAGCIEKAGALLRRGS